MMKLWVLVPDWVVESDDVRSLVELDHPWLQMPGASVPGGNGGPVFLSSGFRLLHPTWTEQNAKLYAEQWFMDLQQIEVTDVFAERLGIRPDRDSPEVA